MTAGSAAIPRTNQLLHHFDDTLPYKPRRLTRAERNHREVFVYYSPKNQRIVTIADALQMALAIKYEFDPTTRCFVERPRRLRLNAKTEIDVSFWIRLKVGDEESVLAMPDDGKTSSTSGTVLLRDRTLLENAARAQGFALRYITERELLAAQASLAIGLELLPWVWFYGRIAVGACVREHILARLTQVERVTVSNLVRTLPQHPSHVRATIAALVHDGTLALSGYSAGAADAVLEVRRV